MSTTIPPSGPRSPATASAHRHSRRSGWAGLTFVVLLLLSAGMASVPEGSEDVATIRTFYADNGPIVLVAQVVGLVAAVLFAVHASALARVVPNGWSGRLRAAGFIVAFSAALTALPVLALTAAASRSSDRSVAGLARASDLTDVLLFAAMAVFAIAMARAFGRSWISVLSGIVAVLTAARSVLLAFGSGGLGLAAPLAFIALVLVSSVRQLTPARRESQARRRRRQADR